MIDQKNIKIINEFLKTYDTGNINFKYNNVDVTISFNTILHENNSFILRLRQILTEEEKVKGFVSNEYLNKYFYDDKRYLNFKKNFLNYTFEPYVANFFINKITNDENKLQDFWKKLNQEISNKKFDKTNLISRYNWERYGAKKGKCLYLGWISKLPKGANMSKEHEDYLKESFKIPQNTINILKQIHYTIKTTNDYKKSRNFKKEHKMYYEKDFKIKIF